MLTVEEIIEATGGKIIQGKCDGISLAGASIDSRTIGEGELFIALKGERFDGHDFVIDALKNGRAAIVSTPPAATVEGRTIIHVKNTLKALQDIAHYLRMKRRATLIGVTGTNGKTTTKELTASILGICHRVVKNPGNLNNPIGLPLSLTKIGEEDEFAVMEMGASMKGDIRELCRIAVPDCGVITNIGPGHLEGFGSLESVRSTKLELFDAVKTVAVNADDGFLMEGIQNRIRNGGPGTEKNIITFGITDKSDVYAKDIILEERRSLFTLCLRDGRCFGVTMNVNGRFNIYNALAAASICSALGAAVEEIRGGIESFAGVPMRLEVKNLLGVAIISDIYNANPASMEEAIKELVRLRRRRAIAVLGDMLELGGHAEESHRRLGRWMSGLPVDLFIAVGPLMAKAAEEFSAARGNGSFTLAASEKGSSELKSGVAAVAGSSEAREILLDLCFEGDTVLVKGSRGMHMEEVLESPAISRGLPARETENAL